MTKVRVQIRQKDGTLSYDQEHEAVPTSREHMQEITFRPDLPAIANGETLRIDEPLEEQTPA